MRLLFVKMCNSVAKNLVLEDRENTQGPLAVSSLTEAALSSGRELGTGLHVREGREAHQS